MEVSMKHCCSSCFCECDGNLFVDLKNGRKIFFCCDKCKKKWQKNREKYLAKESE